MGTRLGREARETKAVLFDYDDTLVRTRLCKYRALQAVGSRYYGIELLDADIDLHWGVAYEALFQNLFGAVEEDVRRAMQRYEALDDEFAMTAYPDSLPVLRALSERGPIGIVTAAGRSIVERQLGRLGLPLTQLTVLQTAEDTSWHKPDPRVFEPALLILQAGGIRRAEVLYVGDSLNDFRAARDAGLRFVGVSRGTTAAQQFADAGATSVESLEALLAWLA